MCKTSEWLGEGCLVTRSRGIDFKLFSTTAPVVRLSV